MGKSIDVVIVSNALSSQIWYMTQNAVNTSRKNAGMEVGKVVVVEQELNMPKYEKAETLFYDFPFNYNRCLNLGRFVCKSEYIAFCNNDVYFEDKWAKNCIGMMEKNNFLSASPTNRFKFNGVKIGYEVGKQVLGWCIVTNVKVFDYIGKFDEPVEFWYSDNVYANQIERAGIPHILVGTSQVRHFTSTTLAKIKGDKRKDFMRKQKQKFDNYVRANTQIKTKTGNGD